MNLAEELNNKAEKMSKKLLVAKVRYDKTLLYQHKLKAD